MAKKEKQEVANNFGLDSFTEKPGENLKEGQIAGDLFNTGDLTKEAQPINERDEAFKSFGIEENKNDYYNRAVNKTKLANLKGTASNGEEINIKMNGKVPKKDIPLIKTNPKGQQVNFKKSSQYIPNEENSKKENQNRISKIFGNDISEISEKTGISSEDVKKVLLQPTYAKIYKEMVEKGESSDVAFRAVSDEYKKRLREEANEKASKMLKDEKTEDDFKTLNAILSKEKGTNKLTNEEKRNKEEIMSSLGLKSPEEIDKIIDFAGDELSDEAKEGLKNGDLKFQYDFFNNNPTGKEVLENWGKEQEQLEQEKYTQTEANIYDNLKSSLTKALESGNTAQANILQNEIDKIDAKKQAEQMANELGITDEEQYERYVSTQSQALQKGFKEERETQSIIKQMNDDYNTFTGLYNDALKQAKSEYEKQYYTQKIKDLENTKKFENEAINRGYKVNSESFKKYVNQRKSDLTAIEREKSKQAALREKQRVKNMYKVLAMVRPFASMLAGIIVIGLGGRSRY